jgi:hypothetical protein
MQEMRTRGFHPWRTDRPILRPLHPTYTLVDKGGGSGIDFCGSGGVVGPGGSGGAASFSGGPISTGGNHVLSNPFQDPGLLGSMRHQWQQLPNWKSATVEGLTWEGTAEENAKKYVDLVGIAESS